MCHGVWLLPLPTLTTPHHNRGPDQLPHSSMLALLRQLAGCVWLCVVLRGFGVFTSQGPHATSRSLELPTPVAVVCSTAASFLGAQLTGCNPRVACVWVGC